ncbi:MAG: type II secretion system F family protein [Sedimentisphaerales bacterium]|nr:type II secretion system F family protein [Sedimentisphaerales bacterium]
MGKTAKLALAYHNLSVTLDAGVGILRAFDMVSQGQTGGLKKAFLGTRESISKGGGLSESMKKYRRVFPEVDLMLIETAETSGKYPECFKMLSNWHEFQIRILRIIKSGLILPILVLITALFILPLPRLITDPDVTMQVYLIMALRPLIIIFVSVFLLIYSYRFFKKLRFLKYILDTIILWIPLLGKAVWELAIARFCFTFNMLNKAGVPILQGLPLAVNLTGNTVVAKVFQGGVESVQNGNSAFEGFSSKMPNDYRNLWEVGEETGELSKTVDKIAEISSDKADMYFTEFAKWFPKIVYGIICLWMIGKIFSGYSNLYQIPEF